LKRSNRLLILLGIVLAVIAFGAVLLLGQGGGGGTNGGTPTPPPVAVVIANQDIPVGTVLTADMLTTKPEPAVSAPANGYKDPQQLVGLIVRTDVTKGEPVTGATFQGNQASSVDIIRRLQKGFRAMAVQVDQLTGVGTLLQPGDHVDVVLALEGTDNKNPVVIEGAPTREGNPPTTVRNFTAIGPDQLNRTSIKVLVQNVEVLGTLLPPPPTTSNTQSTPQPSASPNGGTASLNGRQQLVILALTPQQVELTRFAQLDGNLSLVLRATADNSAPPDATPGITLRVLVDTYQVVIPQIVLQQLPPPVGR
jgi:pilus assembly protein CpaB